MPGPSLDLIQRLLESILESQLDRFLATLADPKALDPRVPPLA